jgi:hypothetical protein
VEKGNKEIERRFQPAGLQLVSFTTIHMRWRSCEDVKTISLLAANLRFHG